MVKWRFYGLFVSFFYFVSGRFANYIPAKNEENRQDSIAFWLSVSEVKQGLQAKYQSLAIIKIIFF
jgi:hypothetical protein